MSGEDELDEPPAAKALRLRKRHIVGRVHHAAFTPLPAWGSGGETPPSSS